MKTRNIFKSIITIVILSMLFCSTMAYASDSTDAVVVVDNEYYKIAEKTDGNILYRAINDKYSNIITLYTIIDDAIVDTQIFDLNEVGTISSRILYPVQSQTNFGYALDNPLMHFRCPTLLRDARNLSSAAIDVDANIYPTYQEDFIDAVDDMINLELQLEAYSTEENFTAIMVMIVGACLNPASAFDAAITATTYETQEKALAKQIHAKEIIATSRFLFLYDFDE